MEIRNIFFFGLGGDYMNASCNIPSTLWSGKIIIIYYNFNIIIANGMLNRLSI